ncbi:unnamed protein product [Rotaria sordida]|uniref:Uncharacterized protein n=1 Tax=Rotaria sordida TaxID=392033 RepID=A0A820BLU7_9BILA|nr:unnamed protein product [Rotaria sordida]
MHRKLEHYDKIILQLNPLTDEINTIDNRLITIDIKELTIEYCKQLEQWQLQQIIINKIDKQKNEINLIRKTLNKLIDEQEASQQDINLIKKEIYQFNENLNNIEHTSFKINIQPLLINDNLIEIEEKSDLHSILSLPFKTIDFSEIKSLIIATNDQYLLIHQNLYLYLIDYDFKIIKKLPWHLERIKDICWSSTFHRFILTTENYGICFVYENAISLDNANCFKQEKFHSCTCSNTSLFLTVDDYGSSIMEYHLLPLIELIKQWKSPYTCTKDEYIDSIRYNNAKI